MGWPWSGCNSGRWLVLDSLSLCVYSLLIRDIVEGTVPEKRKGKKIRRFISFSSITAFTPIHHSSYNNFLKFTSQPSVFFYLTLPLSYLSLFLHSLLYTVYLFSPVPSRSFRTHVSHPIHSPVSFHLPRIIRLVPSFSSSVPLPPAQCIQPSSPGGL